MSRVHMPRYRKPPHAAATATHQHGAQQPPTHANQNQVSSIDVRTSFSRREKIVVHTQNYQAILAEEGLARITGHCTHCKLRFSIRDFSNFLFPLLLLLYLSIFFSLSLSIFPHSSSIVGFYRSSCCCPEVNADQKEVHASGVRVTPLV
jgi:hypothetical protein